jgi:hypothetical protein
LEREGVPGTKISDYSINEQRKGKLHDLGLWGDFGARAVILVGKKEFDVA